MSEDKFILPPSDRPSWVDYPRSFCRLAEQGLVNLTPWHLMESQRALTHYHGLAKRYPVRKLFPFAYRQDNDDVACWAQGMGEQVLVIHDFASPGWEDEGKFDDVWSWFRSAIDETILWE